MKVRLRQSEKAFIVEIDETGTALVVKENIEKIFVGYTRDCDDKNGNLEPEKNYSRDEKIFEINLAHGFICEWNKKRNGFNVNVVNIMLSKIKSISGLGTYHIRECLKDNGFKYDVDLKLWKK